VSSIGLFYIQNNVKHHAEIGKEKKLVYILLDLWSLKSSESESKRSSSSSSSSSRLSWWWCGRWPWGRWCRSVRDEPVPHDALWAWRDVSPDEPPPLTDRLWRFNSLYTHARQTRTVYSVNIIRKKYRLYT